MKSLAQKLKDIADAIAAVTSEDYLDNAAELFSGEDVDALTTAAAALDGNTAGETIAVLRRRLAIASAMSVATRDVLITLRQHLTWADQERRKLVDDRAACATLAQHWGEVAAVQRLVDQFTASSESEA